MDTLDTTWFLLASRWNHPQFLTIHVYFLWHPTRQISFFRCKCRWSIIELCPAWEQTNQSKNPQGTNRLSGAESTLNPAIETYPSNDYHGSLKNPRNKVFQNDCSFFIVHFPGNVCNTGVQFYTLLYFNWKSCWKLKCSFTVLMWHVS